MGLEAFQQHGYSHLLTWSCEQNGAELTRPVYRRTKGWMGRVRSPEGESDFLFSEVSTPVMGPTQPPIQLVPGAISLGLKQPVCEADYSPPSRE
jgi:hypothetical protein